MWKAVGAVLLLCGALITAWTPDSAVGQAAYLICFAGMGAAAWTATLRSSARGRRTPWVLVSAAVSSWLAGDVTWGILQLTDAETDVGLQDLFWLAGYPLLAAAMLSIVRRRGPGRGRAALQDGLTLTTAATVAAWQLFIAPGLDDDGSALTVFVGALYPVGDLVLLAAVLYLVLSPGRTGLPGKLLVAGTALMMLLDTGITLVTDLDGFKAVNDEHGHAAGDAVLVEVARRVRGQVRSSDLSARLGGDEFAVLCAGMSDAQASELAERLEYALREPILADGAVVHVGGSVGIASAAECIDGSDLLSRADQAMFAVKQARRAEKTYSRI